MTTYYVSPSGNDSNNGLGPDASHASNKPFLTIGKLIAASGAMASGDTAYIAPGTYRQTVQVGITSPTGETQILGDPSNAQGFKDGSGVPLVGGDVIWTAYTTNDTTIPSASSLLDPNGRDFLTFKYIYFMGGRNSTGSCVNATAAHSTDIKLEKCAFNTGGTSTVQIAYTGLADTAANWTIDSCHFEPFGPATSSIQIIIPTTATAADYDINFQIKNCVFIGSGNNQAINIGASGALSNKGGGVDCFNCDFYACNGAFRVANTGNSTTIPCTIYNSAMLGVGGTALNANTSGQILEDNNRILAVTARTNVTAGGASIVDTTHAPLVEIGYELISGRQLRPFMMPMVGSPLLGRGATAGGPTVDILGRARPSGGGSTSYAWGAFERHDTAAKETSVVDVGPNAAKIAGPGDQDLHVPVDASSTTITIRVRYDTNHATTNKPQVILLANGEIGVATETKTATVGVDTYETLTFSSFTPTAKGVVTLRCVSRSAAGNGIAYFDTVTGGAQGTQGLDYWRMGELLPAAVATGGSGGVKSNIGLRGGING